MKRSFALIATWMLSLPCAGAFVGPLQSTRLWQPSIMFATSSEKEEYRRQLLAASHDPKLFEQLVRKQNGAEEPEEEKAEEDPDKPKPVYQRIEDWDADQKDKDELKWEQRVQYDGQRFGNQVAQNDILRRNLKGF